MPIGMAMTLAIRQGEYGQKECGFSTLRQCVEDRFVKEDRLAEITLQQVADEIDILKRDGLIESELLAQFCDICGSRLRAQHDGRRIARRDPDDDEDYCHHQKHDNDHADKALQYVAKHLGEAILFAGRINLNCCADGG